MKKKIEGRIKTLTNTIATLKEQQQTILQGIEKLRKALQEADLAIIANQSKLNELNDLIGEEKK